jgi:hypothetical protein
MSQKKLIESIADWDVAAYHLGNCLGLMPDAAPFGGAKGVFWSNHPIGGMLYAMLDRLVEQGVLERRDEPDIQYRWNPEFRGSWEDPVGHARKA